MVFAIVLVALSVLAGLATRRRINTYTAEVPTALTDDHIRQLERHGWVDVDETLDLREIGDEEVRFWEETSWEEPEETG